MEALPRLKARTASLHELRDLFRALRAMAASHVQEAQDALAGIREYVGVVEESIAEAAGLLARAPDGLAREVAGDSSALVVVCSEHGFAGAFNERLLDRAAETRQPGQDLLVIGSRGAALAEERGLELAGSFAMATHVGGILGVTRRVADRLASVATADVVFGSYKKGGGYAVAARRILPLDPALLAGAEGRSPPLHHLEPALLLQRLAGEYLFAEITRAVMESFASENAARLRTMEAADRNIDDKLGDLQRRANALRQEAITEELLDVVTGSEAILRASRS
ncbi:MAG: F0F1 ATP synthase subunit gamma [Kiloniellaceae bacterium]